MNDAGLLASLGARLFEEAFGTANAPDDMRAYLATAFSVETQAAELSDPDRVTVLATSAEGDPIGYAMLKYRRDLESVAAVEPVELQRIYVDRRWHGRGVGNALMERCVTLARAAGAGAIWLGVWQENPRAIAFYRRLGFEVVGTQTFQLGTDRQEDFIMARSLS